PVQYLIHNPKPDEKEIVDAYRTLERAGVSIILGGAVNRAGMIIAKEAKRSGVPTLGITASTHALNDQKDNFYRLAASTRGVSSNLAAHLMRKNISRVAILTSVENKARADPLAEAFREAFARESIKIPFGSPETAFKTMWDWQPEVVFSILPETDLIQVIREVKAKKPGPMIISAEWGFDNVVSMFSGPLLNGVRSCTRIGYISPAYREILHEFEKTHDLRATFASVNAFSCLSVVYRALEEAGGDRDRLRAWLDQPRIHDVGHGKIFLNEFGDSIMQHHYIQEISDDRLILIEKVKVREFPWENEFDS
ncbi:MAG: amino acid ABC transporter substrate-binding protein, partial [Desulfobacterales bacterium]|nr:amino acid ABC transporter substrate-binding protein [Desulfobacterales bacterium]